MPAKRRRELYYGDSRDVLRRHIKAESIDLIYLDPPFNSNANYNMIFGKNPGMNGQFLAFPDTWVWSAAAARRVQTITDDAAHPARLYIEAMLNILGPSGMLSYLGYMAERLVECRRVLKATGSIFLHCDTTAGRYLHQLMDAIFGTANFQNTIVWQRVTSGQKGNQYKPRKLGRIYDTIFFYQKDAAKAVFNAPKQAHTEEELEAKFNREDEDGSRWMDNSAHIWSTPDMGARPNLCYEWRGFTNPHPSGWRLSKKRQEEEYQKGNFEIIEEDGKRRLIRKMYWDDYLGENIGDLWGDIRPARGKERVSYPTQKPLALLHRIIETASNKGALVLDPFCGSGTAAEAAEQLGRGYIGIDVSTNAVRKCQERLKKRGYPLPKVTGIPKDLKGAQALAQESRYGFENWAVQLVPGFYPDGRRGNDGGKDGVGLLAQPVKLGKRKTAEVLCEVKSGGWNINYLRSFLNTVRQWNVHGAAMGVLVTMKKAPRSAAVRKLLANPENFREGEIPLVHLWSVEEHFDALHKNEAPRPPQLPPMRNQFTGRTISDEEHFLQLLPLG